MRVAIPHNLDRAEVRRRLRERSGEIADFVPVPMATVRTDWPSDNVMNLNVAAMGQSIDGQIEVDDDQVVFEIDLPPALGFIAPLIEGAIRDKGRKLLT
jgi:hypothetical protein